jgi:class 3 adenylate cyclase/tetratricopeptide (TPR) repeat protein
MKCPKCQHENRAEAKYCEECAAPLARDCPNCGTQVWRTAESCPRCGHLLKPVADDPPFASPVRAAAVEGERKQVTVLFADIKGSMELFADRDPEDAQKLYDPVLERMIEAIRRYEGTVHRVMGDGIMALFGAPIAQEDHAVRACYAALRMQETVTEYADQVQRSHGVPVSIRVGLHSGEIVLVGAVGNNLHMDYTVVGQTANLAARMEQIARPGCVLTTAETFRLAEGYVAMKPLGPVSVKGIPDPIQIYEVTGASAARTRLEVAAERGLTRFVGRDVEMEQLHRAQQLSGDGQGQLMAIVGEAGVGKSRLLGEFVHSHHTTGWLVLESNCGSHGRATPYRPVIDLLRHYFKISDHDSTESIREKVTGRISTFGQSLEDAIPPVLDLLDSLDDAHPFRSLDLVQRRQYTYQAVVRLLVSESRVSPVVAVFEDLHGSDPLTLGLLEELVIGAQSARLLLIVTYRPEYKDGWGSRPNYCQLSLRPLASESLADFLQALLGSDPSLPTVKGFLVERATGNPFFAEEIVQALANSGVLEGARGSYRLARPFSRLEIPPTVHAVLAARVDALPAAEKHLLQKAAVIGQDVPFSLLRAVCGLTEDALRHLLSNLRTAGFFYATRLAPDLQYTFKHSLTREVAYAGVLHDRRRGIHGQVLEAIEKVYANRLVEQVERLAYHAVRALNEKAVHYLRQAGAKAAARTAFMDARAWFEQALDILKSGPETPATLEQAFEIRLELRSVLRLLGEIRQMLEQLREAEILAERLKNDLRRGQVCAFMTTVLSTLDELDEAVVTGNRALEIAHDLDDLRLHILATSHLEMAHYYRGAYEHVVELAEKNLAELPPGWVHEYFGMTVPASVFSRAYLIMSLAELGRFADAARYEAEAIQLAQPTQDAHTIGYAQFAASVLHLSHGEWTKARLLIEQWIDTCRVVQTPSLLPWAVASSAWALAQVGEATAAVSRIGEAEKLLERQTEREISQHRSWAYGALGRACLLLGRVDEAGRLGRRSLEFAQRQPGFTAHALLLLGDLATHPDQFDAETGAAHYRQALALAERHGMRPLAAHCHFGLAKLYSRVGQPEHARDNLAAATTLYREMGMDVWLNSAQAQHSGLV